jgi:membrane-bound serine protease (ClpP class)
MDNVTFALSWILIVLGLLLLVAELFVTSGFLALLALCCLGAGIALPFYYGDPSTGVVNTLVVVLGVPTLIGFFMRYTTSAAFARRMLKPPGPEEDATVAKMPVNVELEQLRGRIGRAVSPLRPSGVVDFDGKRIDTLTEGFPVDAGAWVRCIEVKAGRVIVRQVDGPDGSESEKRTHLTDLENLDFT